MVMGKLPEELFERDARPGVVPDLGPSARLGECSGTGAGVGTTPGPRPARPGGGRPADQVRSPASRLLMVGALIPVVAARHVTLGVSRVPPPDLTLSLGHLQNAGVTLRL